QLITTVCCGWANRGLALGDGKVFEGLLDGSFIALDQKSGDLLWTTQICEWQRGCTITAAPAYYDGVVYTGVSGGEFGTRGKLTALDTGTGQELWRVPTHPRPPGVGRPARAAGG